jgi:hypothetical protein
MGKIRIDDVALPYFAEVCDAVFGKDTIAARESLQLFAEACGDWDIRRAFEDAHCRAGRRASARADAECAS